MQRRITKFTYFNLKLKIELLQQGQKIKQYAVFVMMQLHVPENQYFSAILLFK